MASGFRDGWLLIKWSQFFHSIGFTQIDPNKPLNWSDFIINRLEEKTFIKSEEEL